MKKKILIVEDEATIADTLEYVLRSEGFATCRAELGKQALEILAIENIALVILDVGLPDQSGFDVCRELRRVWNTPVLFLTARSDEVDRIVGLELGADDYVAKPFSPREVASRVRAILRRTAILIPGSPAAPQSPTAPTAPTAATTAETTAPSPSGSQRTLFEIDPPGHRIAYCGTWLTLTRYEYGLLSALLARPNRILSRAQLMELVWHDAEESMDRTVDAHIKTLRAKLRTIHSDPIETHRGQGYSVRDKAP